MDFYSFPDVLTLVRTLAFLALFCFAPGYVILKKKIADRVELAAASVLSSAIILALISSLLSLLIGLNFVTLALTYVLLFVVLWKLNAL